MSKRSKALLTILLAIGLAGINFDHSVDAARIELTLRDLATQATDIITARVISTKSQWNEAKNFILTTITLQATEPIKGSLQVSSTVTVLVPGGEVDGVGLGVEHAAKFKVGEEVIVFLHPIDTSIYGVVGWEQGKYTLEGGQVKEKGISVTAFQNQIREALR